jgi:CBS domain containing-hemolysin-like protein
LALLEHLPLILVMLACLVASAFFSCSEAALFSLTRQQRAALGGGTDAQRAVAELLRKPDRVLTAILFGNLVVNMAMFTLSSAITLKLQASHPESSLGGWFAFATLVAVILLGELAPKNVGVLNPPVIAPLVCLPLAAVVKALDPIAPLLRGASDVSGRLILPRIEKEPYLELGDLERAVEIGGGDLVDGEAILLQERQVLQRVVELAEASAAELMRPRRRCVVLHPPVTLANVPRESVHGDFLLVTEPDSDEIAAAIAIDRLALAPPDRLERHADPVVFVPWSASASAVLTQLREKGRRVAAIVNELGETVGIVTLEQLLDAVLRDATRADPNDVHAARLRQLPGGAWEASGSTALRRLTKRLGIDEESTPFDEVRSVTVAGLLQELLERSACKGDRVRFGGYDWVVTAGPDAEGGSDNAPVTVRIREAASELPPDNPAAGEGRAS